MPKLGNLIPEDIFDYVTRIQEFYEVLLANTRDKIGNSEYLKILVKVTIYVAKLAKRVKNATKRE
jgi:hypothetical protein